MARVVFLPEGIACDAPAGRSLLEAAEDGGYPLPHQCGGCCSCTTCHLRVCRGGEALSPMRQAEAVRLDEADGRTAASRLGCQARIVRADAEIVVEALRPSDGWGQW